MLRTFLKRKCKAINLTYASSSNSFSSKSNKDNTPLGESMTARHLTPNEKIIRSLRRDKEIIKKTLMFWKEHKNNAVDENGQVLNWDDPNAPIFPNYCDVVIIGGGAIGSSIAYWCKKFLDNTTNGSRIVVVEKDPTYSCASTVLSVGGLRQQFSLEENIEMSLYGAEFIRNINQHLGIEGEPPIDVQFHPYGYLSLATAETAEVLQKNSEFQNYKGAKNVLLTSEQLKIKFPWLTVDDIELGCLGVQNEGWFDPWSLLSAFKRKAISLGVDFVTGEVKGFNFKQFHSEDSSIPYEPLEYMIVETNDGVQRPIYFSKCILAAGASSGQIARMARIGEGSDVLSVPLPVEPRKRYVYCFHAPDGPGLNTPLTIDPSGVYFRREGLANHFICGRSPEENEEPPVDNLDVDPEFFDNKIWPALAHRVKAFENLKVKSSWAGYYEYNTFDENGIVGVHPYHTNIIFATGFSGHGIQKAPAVGRAVAELLRYESFQTINLNRLCFNRFITLEPMKEKNIW